MTETGYIIGWIFLFIFGMLMTVLLYFSLMFPYKKGAKIRRPFKSLLKKEWGESSGRVAEVYRKWFYQSSKRNHLKNQRFGKFFTVKDIRHKNHSDRFH